jgi:hypothetical protein
MPVFDEHDAAGWSSDPSGRQATVDTALDASWRD